MLSVHENTYYISLSKYLVKFCILGRITVVFAPFICMPLHVHLVNSHLNLCQLSALLSEVSPDRIPGEPHKMAGIIITDDI